MTSPDRTGVLVGRLLQRWRALWRQQLHLHQLYLHRLDVSGRDAVRACRSMRWCGDSLYGDLLPGDLLPSDLLPGDSNPRR